MADLISVQRAGHVAVAVGSRIDPPSDVFGSSGDYWAGYILQTNGNSFAPNDYFDPFVFGFQMANQGARKVYELQREALLRKYFAGATVETTTEEVGE